MSQTTATISCATASGKPLEELSRLIAARANRLGELTKDAAIATAINILNSLRADTRDARAQKRFSSRVVQRGDLIISFKGASHRLCMRSHSRNGGEVKGNFVFASKCMDLKNAQIFEITPEHERRKTYFLVAYSQAHADKYEKNEIAKRIAKKGGLAKSALSVAMAKLSTRNSPDDSPRLAKILASNLSHVTISGGGFGSGSFNLSYFNQLDYALDALKSGAASFNLALQKAANRTAGLINHTLHKLGDLDHDVETPFPEVKKTR